MVTSIQSRDVWFTTMRTSATPRIPSMNWSRPDSPGGRRSPGVSLRTGDPNVRPVLLHGAPRLDERVRPDRHLVVIGGGHPANLVVRAVETWHPAREAFHPLAHHVVGGV